MATPLISMAAAPFPSAPCHRRVWSVLAQGSGVAPQLMAEE